MKKSLAVLLALLMLTAWLPALAEDSAQSYQNTTFGYSIDYTQEWLLVDKDTLDSFIAQITDGTVVLEGLTPSALYAIQVAIEQAVPDSRIIFTDMLGNAIDVTCSALPTPSDMQMALQGVAPLLVSMFSTMYTDIEIIDSGSIASFNNQEFLKLAFQINADEIVNDVTIYCYFQNDLLYAVTFTWAPFDPAKQAERDETMEIIMKSFRLDE